MMSLLILLILVCTHAGKVSLDKEERRLPAWLKRDVRQADMGPFWANRGKKAPKYLDNRLFAEEPHWVLLRRGADQYGPDYDPYFTARGKKNYFRKVLAELQSLRTAY